MGCSLVDTTRYNRGMKAVIVGLLTLFLTLAATAQEASVVKDIITDPNLSLRCKELMQERADKIKVRQRLSDLLQRNQKLLKQTPKMKQSLRSPL